GRRAGLDGSCPRPDRRDPCAHRSVRLDVSTGGGRGTGGHPDARADRRRRAGPLGQAAERGGAHRGAAARRPRASDRHPGDGLGLIPMGLSWLGLGPVGPIPMGLGLLGLVGPSPMGLSLLGLVGPSPMGLSLMGLVGPSPMGLSLMGLVLVGLISTGRISCRTWPPAPWAPLWASILRPAPRGTSPAER